ncbi:RING finger protein 214 [Discoglossus pictus]
MDMEAIALHQPCSTNGIRSCDQDAAEISGVKDTAGGNCPDKMHHPDMTVHLSSEERLDGGIQTGHLIRCIAVQTDFGKQDMETITDANTEQDLMELVSRREQLKDSYQEVLDKQTQAEKQLQVQIKQLKQKREEEMQRHKDTLRSIQELTVKKEETKKRMEKERKENSQREQDLGTDLEKLHSKSHQLKQQQEELESKIVTLLAEQTNEREEWDAELTSLKSVEDELTRSVLEETERAMMAEVLSLESQRDLFLISLEEAENEAEVTLSCLRVATPTLEWIQLKQRWDARMAGIQQMKQNLREQFESQIQRVKSGTNLSSLPSVSAPNLPPPPSDTNLLLQRIALSPLQGPVLPMTPPPREPLLLQAQIPVSFPCQPPPTVPHIPGLFPNTIPTMPQTSSALHIPGTSDLPAPAGADKLGKILEKLHARFPHCHKAQLTGIMQQIKVTRGTLAGLTVEELCQLVATRLIETPDFGARVTLPQGNGRPQYPAPKGAPMHGSYSVKSTQGILPFKLCLICQKLVLPTDLQPMPCSHTMHRECIKMKFWAQTNQKNSCPFCPSHR